MLFALGLGDRTVGVTTYCRYPAQARALPKIGSFAQIDFERVTALKPDLIAAENNGLGIPDKMRRLGWRTVDVRHGSVREVLDAIRTIGAATGTQERAAGLATAIQRDLDQIRAQTSKRPARKVAFIVGRNPGTVEGLIATGPGSYLNEILEAAGGRNVFSGSAAPYPKISAEHLIAGDPDILIDMAEMASGEALSPEKRDGIIRLWGKYPTLRAVRTKKVIPVSNDAFVVAGPRMVEAARLFAEMLR